MIGIVIAAHGGLAREYLAALEHVIGKQAGVCAVAIYPEDDRALKRAEICAAAEAVDAGAGVVMVTDMFGGSPSNLALDACAPENRKVLYGANLPMLIKLAKLRGLSLGAATAGALAAGRKYIDCCDGLPARPAGREDRP